MQVCFRDVVFPLLPRMRGGLYYNTFIVSHAWYIQWGGMDTTGWLWNCACTHVCQTHYPWASAVSYVHHFPLHAMWANQYSCRTTTEYHDVILLFGSAADILNGVWNLISLRHSELMQVVASVVRLYVVMVGLQGPLIVIATAAGTPGCCCKVFVCGLWHAGSWLWGLWDDDGLPWAPNAETQHSSRAYCRESLHSPIFGGSPHASPCFPMHLTIHSILN